MPFCTECGARHDEGAAVCPKCGEPIFESSSDDLDDILGSLDADADTNLDLPPGPESEARDDEDLDEYLAEMHEARTAIAAQSSALQTRGNGLGGG